MGRSERLVGCHENKCQESRAHSKNITVRNIVERQMGSNIVLLLREEELSVRELVDSVFV